MTTVLLIIAGAILCTFIYLVYNQYFGQVSKINVLTTKNILLELGFSETLSYKKIVDNHQKYHKINRHLDDHDFIPLATTRAIRDILNLKRYDQLAQYLTGYEKMDSSMIRAVHSKVCKECNGHVGHLISEEIDRVIKMSLVQMKLKAIKSLIAELEYAHFEGFPFVKGNRAKAKKIEIALQEEVDDSKKGVISITTPIEKKENTA